MLDSRTSSSDRGHSANDYIGSRADVSHTDSSERLRTSVTNQDMLQLLKNKPTTTPTGSLPSIDSVAEFSQRAQRIFGNIDTDHNGLLSRRELGSAVQSHRYVGEDAQVLAGLFHHSAYPGLVTISDDQKGQETELSRRDIQGMVTIDRRRILGQIDEFVTLWASANFNKLDTNKNGFIHMSELEQLKKNRNTSAYDKLTIQRLEDRYAVIQQSSNDEWFFENDGMTRADIGLYSKPNKGISTKIEAIDKAIEFADRTHVSQTDARSDRLYAAEDPRRSINPGAVRQGAAGDCYFMAALASIAHNHPERIERMIKDNRNGTYTVTFPGDPRHPVTVAAPTQAEEGLYNAGTRYGTWAGIMERAFGKWRLEQKNSRTPNANTLVEGADGGDTNAFAFRVLTGLPQEKRPLKKVTNEDVVNDLDSAMNGGRYRRAVTVGIPPVDGAPLTKDGWPTNHLYSILAFERIGKNDGWITIRNPWGEGEKTRDGTMRIRMAEFRRNFDEYYMEGVATS